MLPVDGKRPHAERTTTHNPIFIPTGESHRRTGSTTHLIRFAQLSLWGG
ncbi:hypothetical protein [Spirosoma aerophilum]